MNEKWYDVHFSLSGFMMIKAENESAAQDKAEEILGEMKPQIEGMSKQAWG
jgi:hypothetical protein